MKKQLLNLFFVMLSATAFGQQDMKRLIIVQSVDFSILTSFDITCDRFEEKFKDRLSVKGINQEDLIMQFERYIRKAKFAKKNRLIDVRATFLYVKEKSDRYNICTNGHDISINGKLIKYNEKFADFLVDLTKQ